MVNLNLFGIKKFFCIFLYDTEVWLITNPFLNEFLCGRHFCTAVMDESEEGLVFPAIQHPTCVCQNVSNIHSSWVDNFMYSWCFLCSNLSTTSSIVFSVVVWSSGGGSDWIQSFETFLSLMSGCSIFRLTYFIGIKSSVFGLPLLFFYFILLCPAVVCFLNAEGNRFPLPSFMPRI